MSKLERSGRFLRDMLVQQSQKICYYEKKYGPASPTEMSGPTAPLRDRALNQENYEAYLSFIDREPRSVVSREPLFSGYRDPSPDEHLLSRERLSAIQEIKEAGWQVFMRWNQEILRREGRPRPHWLERHGPLCHRCGSSARGRYAQPWLYIELEIDWTYYLILGAIPGSGDLVCPCIVERMREWSKVTATRRGEHKAGRLIDKQAYVPRLPKYIETNAGVYTATLPPLVYSDASFEPNSQIRSSPRWKAPPGTPPRRQGRALSSASRSHTDVFPAWSQGRAISGASSSREQVETSDTMTDR